MLPAVIYPDPEMHFTQHFRDRLKDETDPVLQDFFVSNTVPSTRRKRMIIIRRDGGTERERELLEVARMRVSIWAESDRVAALTSSWARAIMSSSPTGNPVVFVALNSAPSKVADVETSSVYLMTFDVTLKGRVLSGAFDSTL